MDNIDLLHILIIIIIIVKIIIIPKLPQHKLVQYDLHNWTMTTSELKLNFLISILAFA